MKKQRKIVFKVVEKESRKGTNFAFSYQLRSGKESLYTKTYMKGKIVKAVKDSVGIFTFIKKRQAISFIEENDLQSETIILRVIPVGRGKCPEEIVNGGADVSRVEFFYADTYFSRQDLREPPPGTMCYPAVKVLD